MENKEFKECNCDETNHKSRTEHMVKFALLLLALFLASYLAVYYVLDQMRHAYYIPSAPMENIDRIINEQDKMFQKDMGIMAPSAFPMQSNALMAVKSPIETYKDDKNDEYKMIINLKPFNNNAKNVNVDVQEDKISVTALGEKAGRHSDKVYSFSQSFVLPEKIDTDKVTKEIKHNNYIITMPIED